MIRAMKSRVMKTKNRKKRQNWGRGKINPPVRVWFESKKKRMNRVTGSYS